MKVAYTVFVILVALVAVIFAAHNNTEVEVKFFGWSTTGLLSIVLAVTLVIGLALGVIIMLFPTMKQGKNASSLKKRLLAMEKEKNEIFARRIPDSGESVRPGSGASAAADEGGTNGAPTASGPDAPHTESNGAKAAERGREKKS